MSGLVIGKCYGVQVTHPQQTVLIALADHANDDGAAVYPSIAFIAWKTGYSERQVTRLVGDLQRLGILVLVKKAYRGRPNEYRIDLANAPLKKKFREDASINTDDTQMSPQIPVMSSEATEITGDISDHTGDILTLWGDKTDITDDTQMSPRTVLLTANTEPSLKPSRSGADAPPATPELIRPLTGKDEPKENADQQRHRQQRDLVAKYFEIFARPVFAGAAGRIAGDFGSLLKAKYKPEIIHRFLCAISEQHPTAKADGLYLDSTMLGLLLVDYRDAGCPDELPYQVALRPIGGPKNGANKPFDRTIPSDDRYADSASRLQTRYAATG